MTDTNVRISEQNQDRTPEQKEDSHKLHRLPLEQVDDWKKMEVKHEMTVVVVGSCNVGKTSIIQQFTQKTYRDQYVPTMGADYDTAIIQTEGKWVRLHIHDTSGLESFLWLTKERIQEADAFVFVYDVTEPDSLKSLKRWNKYANRFAKDRNLPKLLLGNKCDLRHKQVVGASTAREFGIPEGMAQLEVSARLGKCLQVSFAMLAAEVLRYRQLGTVQIMGAPTNMSMFSREMYDDQAVEEDPVTTRDIEDYTHLFKIMLVGGKRVGKTSLRYRICKEYFTSEYIATAGFDYSSKSLIVDNERVKVQFWDVSGDEVYDNIRQSYYKGANGFLIVYDVTNLDSFHKAERLLKELDMAGHDNAPKLLVGNKCDSKRKKAVDFSVAKDFADGWRIPVVEASAKHSTNIDASYMKVVLALKRQLAPWKRIYNWSS